jgi:transketolase
VRRVFVETIMEIAERDQRVLLLTGDLGFMALEPFADRFPSRFVNVGVAEQNMVGVATGLAEAGFIPFVYSIAPFAALRPFEFIRNGPVLHHLPVRVVGIGTGFDYGHAGATHHAIEDIGVLRTQAGLSIIVPADSHQARTSILATWDLPGPVYYSLGKSDLAPVPGLEGRFQLGRAQTVRKGGDTTIIAMGAIALEAVAAAEILALAGTSCSVVVVSSVVPPPIEDLEEILSMSALAVTVEAHVPAGGLGSLVCEVVARCAFRCKVVTCAVRRGRDGQSGPNEWHLRRNELDRDSLVRTIQEQWR